MGGGGGMAPPAPLVPLPMYNNCASLGLDVITKRSSGFLATGCVSGHGEGEGG